MKLFMFGSTGDLVKRKVFPALTKLDLNDLEVIAIGRRDLDDESYREFVCKEGCGIKEKMTYIKTDFSKEDFCEQCKERMDKNEINYFYVSMPPKVYELILRQIIAVRDEGYQVKVLFEKPFGNSLQNAKELKKIIKKNKLEDDVFIADHYLFKQGINELLVKNFENMEIYALEKVGLENRITYYDWVGALNDMVQSHLLTILFKFLSKKEISNIKVINYTRKQYDTYEKELGKKSNTETFGDIKLEEDNRKIRLVTGKKLSEKQNYLIIDKKRIDFDYGKAYINMLSSFFNNEINKFPDIEKVILAWEITDKIREKESELEKYPEGAKLEDVIIN